MITYKVGNLIAALNVGDVTVIAHGCNCFNTMKSGIAPKIAKAYPTMYDADQRTLKGDINKLGGYSAAILGEFKGGKPAIGFNLYSQYDWRGRLEGRMELRYDALEQALTKMAKRLRFAQESSKDPDSFWYGKDVNFRIGLPKIGAGLAGGDWAIIEDIIDRSLDGFDVTVYVLK